MFRKYANLRPVHVDHQRFFLNYRNGKCNIQPVGINTMGTIPNKIESFLCLSNPSEFTGHCFRRCSASLLADAGANMSMLKRQWSWCSSSVAEGYVENSLENKNVISTKILGDRSCFQNSKNL